MLTKENGDDYGRSYTVIVRLNRLPKLNTRVRFPSSAPLLPAVMLIEPFDHWAAESRVVTTRLKLGRDCGWSGGTASQPSSARSQGFERRTLLGGESAAATEAFPARAGPFPASAACAAAARDCAGVKM